MTTIDDIAQAAGVSGMTVSRVLNGKADYRRPTFARRAERIRKLAAEMGYRPNTYAQAVRSGRFGSFGLLLGTDPLRSGLPMRMLHGIYAEMSQHGLNLTLAMHTDEMLTSEATVPKLLEEQMADGLMVYYTDHLPPGMQETIDKHSAPTLWINVQHADNCVYPDDRDAGQQATEHLLSLGHQRIAMVDLSHRPSDPAIHYSANDRYLGYAAAMEEAGLAPRRLWDDIVEDPSRRVEVARRWLAADDRPTAIVTLGPSNVIPLFQAALVEGLEVPRDLSLVMFENHPLEYLGPQITTMLIPQEATGRRAVQLLRRLVDNPGRRLPAEAVPFTLDPGESCSPPRQ